MKAYFGKGKSIFADVKILFSVASVMLLALLLPIFLYAPLSQLYRKEHASSFNPPAVPCLGCAFTNAVPAETIGYPATDGNIYWVGDWETGDASQWWAVGYGTGANFGTLNVENSIVNWGNYAAKFSVNPPGNNTSLSRQEAASSVSQTGSAEGANWYYSWSMMLPSSPNKTDGWPEWTNVDQWISTDYCYPVLQLYISGSNSHYIVQFKPNALINGTCTVTGPIQEWDAGPIQYDNWEYFTYHIGWSSDPTKGFVEVFRNGVNILPLTHIRTLWQTANISWQAELYRAGGNLNVIYFDGFRRHDAYDPRYYSSTITPTVSTSTPTPTNTPIPTAIPTPTSVPTVANLIKNGSFENTGSSWFSPWLLQVRSNAAAIINQNSYPIDGLYSANVNVTNSSKTDWNVMLLQHNLNLIAGKTYTVSFWARADTNRNLYFEVQNYSTTHNTYFGQGFSVTPVWEQYTYRFTAPASDSDAFFGINLARYTGNVYIDKVSVIQN